MRINFYILEENANSLMSQKRAGIKEIQEKLGSNCVRPFYHDVQSYYDSFILPWWIPTKHDFKTIEFPVFARPCPSAPRHGFVDSRAVNNISELFNLWKETKKADENAELLICPILTGKYSAVVCPNSLVIGPGNDGVTNGKAGCISFPCLSSQADWDKNNLNAPRMGEEDVTYVEVVENKGKHIVVQLRYGPKPPTTTCYVPKEVKINNIFSPVSDDLLEWEKTCNALIEGDVVYLPGGNMSSHWAVHCIQNKVPVFTEKRPKVGETVYPNSDAFPNPTQKELEDLQYWLKREFSNPNLKMYDDIIRNLCFVIQHSSAWEWGPIHNQVRALGMVGSIYYPLAACLGEIRHWYKRGPGSKYYPNGEDISPTVELAKLFDGGHNHKQAQVFYEDRSIIYQKALNNPVEYTKVENLFKACAEDFNHKYEWGGGYGGKKWGAVASSHENLMSQLTMFMNMKNPTSYRWSRVMTCANTALFTAHNNGSVYGKWPYGQEILNKSSEMGGMIGLTPLLVHVGLGEEINHINNIQENEEDPYVPLEMSTEWEYVETIMKNMCEEYDEDCDEYDCDGVYEED